MPTNLEVKVTKLERMADGSFNLEVDIEASSDGEFRIQDIANELLRGRTRDAQNLFLLEWEGGDNPRGALIDGKPIDQTHNGLVLNQSGEQIGTYQRLVGEAGQSGCEHKILVFTDHY